MSAVGSCSNPTQPLHDSLPNIKPAELGACDRLRSCPLLLVLRVMMMSVRGESVCGRNFKQLEALYSLSDKSQPDPAELRILPAASRYLDYLNL